MVYIFFFNYSFSKFGTVWTRLEKKIPIENPHFLVNKNLKTKHGLNHLNVQIIASCHHSISDKSETTSIFRSLFKAADGMHLPAIVIHSKIIRSDRAIWLSSLVILLAAHCGYFSNADCSFSGYWFSVHHLFLHLEISSWPGGASVRFVGHVHGGGTSREVFTGWLLG